MSTVAPAPTVAPQTESDPYRPALELVAARHGMTVEQWEARAAALDAEEARHRATVSFMRQTPRYREGFAA